MKKILFFFSISLCLNVCNAQRINETQNKYTTFDDLPKINWANDAFSNLSFGLSLQEVSRTLGYKISKIFNIVEENADEEYIGNFSTTWFRSRIIFDEHVAPNFFFTSNKFYDMEFRCFPGYEQELLNSMFDTFGPARHNKYPKNRGGCFFYHGEGSLCKFPCVTNTGETDVYEWYDNEVRVQACKNDYMLTISIRGWRFIQNCPRFYLRDDFNNDANDYLTWVSGLP